MARASRRALAMWWGCRIGRDRVQLAATPTSRERSMLRSRHLTLTALLIGVASRPIGAQARPQGVTDPRAYQTQADDYTRYELLAPGSAKFRILYEVTATTEGAAYFFNPIRKGSVASDERVADRMTGRPLTFDVVKGDVARAGGVRNADSTSEYIRVTLARPVPKEGEARILIDKTYYDPKSYFDENGLLVFNRPLGIKRNAVVLPPGYELVSCNFPSQVIEEADGRIAISFWNNTPSEAPLVLRARQLEGGGRRERGGASPIAPTSAGSTSPLPPPPRPPPPAERPPQTP